MSFDDYLTSKKIDSQEFRIHEPDLWQEWALLFEQLSPASFTAQKLYLINPLRRRYRLKESPAVAKPETLTPTSKPVFKPKIK